MSEKKTYILECKNRRVKMKAIVTFVKDEYSSKINKKEQWWGFTHMPMMVETSGCSINEFTKENIDEVCKHWKKMLDDKGNGYTWEVTLKKK